MSSYKVLIAEDEGLIAHDLASRLETLGHVVVDTAATAEEAIEAAARAEVVLMDIRLDGPKDGIDAAREIRARYHVPVIFLTAHADRRTLERAKLTEPYGYIVKPMAPAALQTTLEIAMYKHAMERKLEERESWLRTTLRSVADAVVVTDVSGQTVLANEAAEKLLGCPRGEFDKIEIPKLLPGDPVALAILRDAPVPLEAEIRGQSLEGSAAPVKASGTTVGCVITLRNVTEQRWREQQVRQAQKMEAAEKLAAAVASQFTSLLGIVRQESQRLLTRFSTSSGVRQSLESIQQAVLEAQEVNSRLAGLGAREVGRPEPVSINRILRRMRKMLDSIASGRVRITIHPEPAAARVFADPDQMEQMILNVAGALCRNAPDDCDLRLATDNVDGSLRLSISCTGVAAIDVAENLEINLASSIATSVGGMVKVENADGMVTADIILPTWHEPEAVPTADAPPRTLLLIESRDSVRTQLHNFFENAGYNMMEAADTEEALALLELHAHSPETGPVEATPGDEIDLVIGDSASTRRIDQVPVLLTDQPAAHALSQSELLERVRSRLAHNLTFSASAK